MSRSFYPDKYFLQKIGKSQKDGFTIDELKLIKENMEAKGLVCEMINLNDALDEELKKQSMPASVLIIRGLMNAEGMSADELFHQLKTIKWDSFLVSTRSTEIQNKLARANLCFSDAWDIPEYTQEKYEEYKNSKVWQNETLSQIYEAQQDYREQLGDRRAKLTREEVFNAKGTVVKWETFGELNKFKQFIENNFGKHANKLVAEGNSYVNYKKCGIGYHGDSERMIVIAIRLGKTFPMHFQWYKNSERIGKNIILPELKHGDVYIMSEKAVGKDWSLRSKITLRHAAGCPKYVN